MRVFRPASIIGKRDGKIAFSSHCHFEDNVLRVMTVECLEGGRAIGKILATIVKHDNIESSLLLKESFFSWTYEEFSFMRAMNLLFEDGARLRLNAQLRGFKKNLMMIEGELFLFDREKYPGEKNDLFKLFCDQNNDYAILSKSSFTV